MELTPQKPSDRANDSIVDVNIDFRYPVLIGVSLSMGETSSDDEENEGELYYRVELNLREASDSDLFSIVFCDFEAGRQINDQAIFKIEASYVVGMKHGKEIDKSTLRRLCQDLARSTAWSKYIDLFSIVCSQSGTDMPRLPPWPEVKWSDTGADSITSD